MSIHNLIFERIALESHFGHMCILFYSTTTLYVDWECKFSMIMHFLSLKYISLAISINVRFYIFSEPLFSIVELIGFFEPQKVEAGQEGVDVCNI